MAVGTEGETDIPDALNRCLRKTGTVISIRYRNRDYVLFLSDRGSNNFDNLMNLCGSSQSRTHADRSDQWHGRTQGSYRLKEAPGKEKTTVKARTGMMSRTVSSECDVRVMSLEEALDAVSLYLDEAVLAGLNEVYIIHGKGTGILRAGIQQDLRKNRHVKGFRRGMYGEGEDGVTVVTLK